jgi:hypothetical protein
MPYLRDAHIPLALGDAKSGQRAADLGSRCTREARRSGGLFGRGNGGVHGGGFYHAGLPASTLEMSHDTLEVLGKPMRGLV